MLLEDYSRKGLTNQVIHWIGKGYICQGGVSIAAIGGMTTYVQAMIKGKNVE